MAPALVEREEGVVNLYRGSNRNAGLFVGVGTAGFFVMGLLFPAWAPTSFKAIWLGLTGLMTLLSLSVVLRPTTYELCIRDGHLVWRCSPARSEGDRAAGRVPIAEIELYRIVTKTHANAQPVTATDVVFHLCDGRTATLPHYLSNFVAGPRRDRFFEQLRRVNPDIRREESRI